MVSRNLLSLECWCICDHLKSRLRRYHSMQPAIRTASLWRKKKTKKRAKPTNDLHGKYFSLSLLRMAAGYAPTGAVILTPCPIIHIFLSFFKSGSLQWSPSAKRNEYFNFLKSMKRTESLLSKRRWMWQKGQ